MLRRVINFDFSYDEQLALMNRAVSRFAEDDRYCVELARIVLQFDRVAPRMLRQQLDELPHSQAPCPRT